MKFLLIQDDQEYSEKIQKVLEGKSATVELITTIELAKQKLDESCDLILIDLVFSDGSGLDIIPDLVKNNQKFMVVSRGCTDADSIQKIKVVSQVPLIVNFPISDESLSKAIEAVLKGEVSTNTLEICEKIHHFQQALQRFRQDPSQENLQAIVDKINADDPQAQILQIIEEKKKVNALKDLILPFWDYINEYKVHLQLAPPVEVASPSNEQPTDRFEEFAKKLTKQENPSPKSAVEQKLPEQKPLEKSAMPAMEELKAKYKETIPAKLEEINNLIGALKEKKDRDALQKMQMVIHKLAGNAGSYGFDEVSKVCKEMDKKLKERLESIDSKPFEEGEIKDLEDLQGKLKELFGASEQKPPEQKPSEQKQEVQPQEQKQGGLDLYVIDPDPEFLELLRQQGEFRGFKVKVTSDPSEGLEEITKDDFSTRLLIVSEKFPDTRFHGFDIVKEHKGKHGEQSFYGIIYEKADLQGRTDAIGQGIHFQLERPLAIRKVLELIRSSTVEVPPNTFKVLVVDDDQEVCEFISATLKEVQVVVETLTDPTQIYDKLHNFLPHLLLLDIRFPNCSGVDILQTLRSDANFWRLPVEIITALEDQKTMEQAYLFNVEGIVIKPIDPHALQIRIGNYAKEHVLNQAIEGRDALTGIYSKDNFLTQIRKLFALESMEGHEHIAFMVKLIYYEAIAERFDHYTADCLVVRFTYAFFRMFPDVRFFGRWEKDVFAVFIPNSSPSTTVERMSRFIDAFRFSSLLWPNPELSLGLSVAVGVYPYDEHTPDALFHKVRDLLDQAVNEGEGAVLCPALSEKRAQVKREVFILDDDIDIQEFLQIALEREGFKVTVTGTVKDAIDNLTHRKRGEMPAIIILDRLLPDGDGLDFFRTIKRKFFRLPPVLFLTVLNVEEEVLVGLREGAADYIAKPFSLSVLLQKIRKYLEKQP